MKNLAPLLAPSVLTASESLPLKPESVVLEGQKVRLEPLDLDRHAQTLFRISSGESFQLGSKLIGSYDPDAMIWRYMSQGPFKDVQELADFLRPQIDAPNGLCFCVLETASNHPVGVANIMNNVPRSLKAELGSIWYSPAAQGTLANTEATYLMLKHLFNLGYRRVEWKCDSLNTRSQKAALRLGFVYEGQHDCHFIVKGRNRDTSWYRMLDRDWPQARTALEGNLELN